MEKSKRDRKVLFEDCEIFIDYFSSQTGCDRSLRLGNELEKKYGAKIVQHPHPQTTTHLIFKNGNLQTKLFAQKHRLPLLDPLWLESSIRKRRLVSLDKYRVPLDENQPQEDLPFDRLIIAQKDSPLPSTPKTQNELKKTRKVLYTPNRDEFDQGNPHEFFDHQQRRITLDQLGLNLQDEEHQLIHRYGCSVARRQIPPPPPPTEPVEERRDSPSPSDDFLPSQSQSSPRVHFAQEIRSLSSTIDFSGERPSGLLAAQPQSTPKSSPILRPRRTTDDASLTKVTPMRTKPTEKEKEEEEEEPVRMPRPPPLLALSQRIRRKHPEEPLIDPLPSIDDLPDSPANYSFVFYQFSPSQIDEAKRLTRRMGDCFALESVDISTTHLIVQQDDPQLNLNFDFLLALLSGCRIVTFEWLKSSSKIGEWLNVNAFEPRRLFQSIPSLNIYRKSRQQNKTIPLFQQSGRIYLTSLVQQRANLLKLIHLLGGDITVNRNQANIVIGPSSKNLPVRIYPQVTERWVLDSIVQGHCLPADAYLLDE